MCYEYVHGQNPQYLYMASVRGNFTLDFPHCDQLKYSNYVSEGCIN